MKILIVVGTRPEAIKLSPLILELKRYSSFFEVKVVSTRQHDVMLVDALDVFGIKPDFILPEAPEPRSLATFTSHTLNHMSQLLTSEAPDLVMVHGDTSTALASAFAAFFLDVEIAHVEAGLRTGTIKRPFPEEMNRQIISRIADYHFAPTEIGRQNLIRDGIDASRIHVTGNTVVDALNFVRKKLDDPKVIQKTLLNLQSAISADWINWNYAIVTAHRRENFGSGLTQICQALTLLSEKYPNLHFIFPVHLNPVVRNQVSDQLTNVPNIHLIQPLNYLEFVYLLSKYLSLLTDSGGLQEEAPSFGKRVILMRESSERAEGVTSGHVTLVGTSRNQILSAVEKTLSTNESIVDGKNPFGDGQAAIKIAETLRNLSKTESITSYK